MPSIISTPGFTISCTSTPFRRAEGLKRRAACMIASKAAGASSAGTDRRTAPASVLCGMSGDSIFIATVPPMSRAAMTAWSAVSASISRVDAMP